SRRRHTRWPRDWSSDVCSSDLTIPPARSSAGERSIAEDRAGGIVWRIENEDAGLRSDFGGDFVEVGLKPILLEQAKGNGNSAEAARERRIDREAGLGVENFVPGLDEGHHREGEGHFASGR